MSDQEVTCISFTGQVTKKPYMPIKCTIDNKLHYYMVDTKEREIGDFIDVKLNGVSHRWNYKFQKDFKTVKVNIHKWEKQAAEIYQRDYLKPPGYCYWKEQDADKEFEDLQVVHICKAHLCILAKWWKINNTIVLMKKENGKTYRWNDDYSHPLIPQHEYIGTFATKAAIRIPPPRRVEYKCSMCRHTQSGMKLKEVKGIEHNCCICMENKASILCTNCSAIHACMECVDKQCKLVPIPRH